VQCGQWMAHERPHSQKRTAQRPATEPIAGQSHGFVEPGRLSSVQIGYELDLQAHDQRYRPQIPAALQANALLIFDMSVVWQWLLDAAAPSHYHIINE
jgi:hypothetical protein